MTKKLVTILAEELPEWPERCAFAVPSRMNVGNAYFYRNGEDPMSVSYSIAIYVKGFSSDKDQYETVTRAEWEAERARIAEDLQMAKHKAGADELERLYAQSFGAEDQALWDKVAVAAMGGLVASSGFHEYQCYQGQPINAAIFGADCADAFMAERAKRMKR